MAGPYDFGMPSKDFNHIVGTLLHSVQFLDGARSSHSKDFKNGSGPCLHGIYDEVVTMKHNLLARCQYNVTMTSYPSEAAL